jgi:hypothetical protein
LGKLRALGQICDVKAGSADSSDEVGQDDGRGVSESGLVAGGNRLARAAAIAIARARAGSLERHSRSGHDSFEFGLQVGYAAELKLQSAFQALNLDLLLLDEAPLFFKLRVDIMLVSHSSSERQITIHVIKNSVPF